MADLPQHLSPAYLREHTQDGWWPYWPGKEASTEATVWCAIACRKELDLSRKSLQYLLSAQNEDGGWSTKAGVQPSDWTSGLAMIAIQILQKELAAGSEKSDGELLAKCDKSVQDGALYLLKSRPDFLNDAARIAMFVAFGEDADNPRGWSWTPNTFYWIEPTSYAVMALKLSSLAEGKRYKAALKGAQDYYMEKVCATGGWNYGVPVSVGAKLPNQIVPTAWALMALHGVIDKRIDQAIKVIQDTDDVRTNTLQAQALSILALNAHHIDVKDRVTKLNQHFSQHHHFSDSLYLAGLCSIATATPIAGNPLIASPLK